MQQTDSRSATWTTAVTLATVGGFLAAAGVFLGWWHVDAFRQSEIFGRELVHEETLAGTANWTGIVGLVAGLGAGALGVVALVSSSAGLHRWAGVACMALGALVVLATVTGALLADTVAEESWLADPALTMEGAVALGLLVSALGGALTALGGLVAHRAGR